MARHRRPRAAASAFVLAVAFSLILVRDTCAQAPSDWPRFRGPNGSGVAADGANPPVTFAPDKNLAWKTLLPPGHSSPTFSNGRLYLTAIENNQLLTLCPDAATGEIRWSKPAPAGKIEKSHPSGSPASATPVTDGKNVYAYFASYGLLAASPVAASGKIYTVNEAGVVTVIKAGDALETLSENDLAERVMATPAIVGDTIYVRTAGRLYAFSEGGK